MSLTTFIIVIPVAYVAAIIWSFLIIKMLRKKAGNAKLIIKILIELLKIVLIIVLTALLTFLGMILLMGILGIPLLISLIIFGAVLAIRYMIKNRKYFSFKTVLKNIYNVILILLLILIPTYLVFGVLIGKQESLWMNYKTDGGKKIIDDIGEIWVRIDTDGEPEVITTYDFPFIKHVRTVHKGVYRLQIFYIVESRDVQKIKINAYDIRVDDSTYSLLDKDFDSDISVKNFSLHTTEDIQLSDEELRTFKKKKEWIVARQNDEMLSHIICNYKNIPINWEIDDVVVFHYDIDVIMKDAKVHHLEENVEFIKELKER